MMGIGTISAIVAAAGAPPGPAAFRQLWERTREGPVGGAKGERGRRDRARAPRHLARARAGGHEAGGGVRRRGRGRVSGAASRAEVRHSHGFVAVMTFVMVGITSVTSVSRKP
jgi:hypothetical protein